MFPEPRGRDCDIEVIFRDKESTVPTLCIISVLSVNFSLLQKGTSLKRTESWTNLWCECLKGSWILYQLSKMTVADSPLGSMTSLPASFFGQVYYTRCEFLPVEQALNPIR